MKILIDDERSLLPDGSRPDILARNYRAGAFLIASLVGVFDVIEFYLDHDLGFHYDEGRGREMNGYDLMVGIEEYVAYGAERPKRIVCVSSNGAGRQKIQATIDKMYGFRE